MSSIDLSIWGIRSGFENKGIYHTHQIEQVFQLQTNEKDALYRDCAKHTSGSGFYSIQFTTNHKIVSYICTEIKEYTSSGEGRRDGFVVFSLILAKGMTFAQSPRIWFEDFAAWYKEQQNNHKINYNNFTDGQIQEKLGTLPVLTRESCSPTTGSKYIENATNIDTLFESKAYLQHKQLFIFPCSGWEEKGILKNTHSKLDVEQQIRVETQNIEKKAEMEAKKAEKKQNIENKNRELHQLIEAKELDKLVEGYNNYAYKNELNSLIKEEVKKYSKLLGDKKLASNLITLFNTHNGQTPIGRSENPCDGLHDLESINKLKISISRENLSHVLDTQVLDWVKECENIFYEQQENCRKWKRNLELENNKKKKKKKMLIAIPAAVSLLLVVSSIVFQVPKSFYQQPDPLIVEDTTTNGGVTNPPSTQPALTTEQKFLKGGFEVNVLELKNDAAFWQDLSLGITQDSSFKGYRLKVIRGPQNKHPEIVKKKDSKYENIRISKKILYTKEDGKIDFVGRSYDSINKLLKLEGKDRFLSFEEDLKNHEARIALEKQNEAETETEVDETETEVVETKTEVVETETVVVETETVVVETDSGKPKLEDDTSANKNIKRMAKKLGSLVNCKDSLKLDERIKFKEEWEKKYKDKYDSKSKKYKYYNEKFYEEILKCEENK